MIRYEKMNPGMEHFTYDELNGLPYFCRRHRWAVPFVVLAATVCAICGGDPDHTYRRALDSDAARSVSGLRNPLHICRMMYYRYAREFTFDEYFYYDFDNISAPQRREYVALYERSRIFGLLSKEDNLRRFKDKYNCYCELSDYYKRDIIPLTGGSDLIAFAQFVGEHPRFVYKPNSASCGKGVHFFDTSSGASAMAIFKQCLSYGPGIVEEYVDQHADMAVFHPQSVNTVRVTTYHDGDDTRILYAMLRAGRQGSDVDNASVGGICAAVDVDTGIIMYDGYSENGGTYDTHPDTGARFAGTQLPLWQELVDMMQSLACVVPDHPVIGWDMACDGEKGWLVIEANAVPNITAAQMCHRRGFRPMLADTVLRNIPNGDLYASARL